MDKQIKVQQQQTLKVPLPDISDILDKENAIKTLNVAVNKLIVYKLTEEVQRRFWLKQLEVSKMDIQDNRGKSNQNDFVRKSEAIQKFYDNIIQTIKETEEQISICLGLIKDIKDEKYKI